MKFCILLTAAMLHAGDRAPLDVPFYSQQKNGCGAASVAMVAHYWANQAGVESPPPLEVYRSLYDESRQGVPLSGMRTYLERLGYRAFTFRGEWTDLVKQTGRGRPVIVGLQKNEHAELHFVVVTGVSLSEVAVNDPAKRSARKVQRGAFARQWAQAGSWMLLAAPVRQDSTSATQ